MHASALRHCPRLLLLLVVDRGGSGCHRAGSRPLLLLLLLLLELLWALCRGVELFDGLSALMLCAAFAFGAALSGGVMLLFPVMVALELVDSRLLSMLSVWLTLIVALGFFGDKASWVGGAAAGACGMGAAGASGSTPWTPRMLLKRFMTPTLAGVTLSWM